ncbi:MAG: substrate-binding domain-containing protein [Bacteroidetes bacterium]|nr:substrate-binding domain-containing protein [Bacteroidota bacterium]
MFFYNCTNNVKNSNDTNTPTSGTLTVYYDEGLRAHIKNQSFTFQSLYKNAHVTLVERTDNEAVRALFADSCKAIVISRLLSPSELQSFASKDIHPAFSQVALSGVVLITNVQTPIKSLSFKQVEQLLSEPFVCYDSIKTETKLNPILDKNNSSVMNYLKDSVLKHKTFSGNCNTLSSTIDVINYIANTKNAVAFIDFAWLSDVDDSLVIANKNKIKILAVSKANNDTCYYPNQSSFKLKQYPFTRTIYVYRNTGDFTLAKGFESFIAGPKGQIMFLKQGLLPTNQQERSIKVNLE